MPTTPWGHGVRVKSWLYMWGSMKRASSLLVGSGLSGLIRRLCRTAVDRRMQAFWWEAREHAIRPVGPLSVRGRELIAFWLDVRQFAEQQLNQACMQYYDGKHPKHYLWLGHNQYLFDHVKPGDRVLDIGCGGSYYTQWIAEKASEVVGVDIRPDRVELAQRNNSRSNVIYQVGDVTQSLPKGPFDVAICSHVIEHLDDPVAFLRSLSKSVPRLIVKVPAVDAHWIKLVKKDIGMFWMDDADHRREYTESLLREHLQAGGWHIEELVRGYDLRASCASSVANCLLDP